MPVHSDDDNWFSSGSKDGPEVKLTYADSQVMAINTQPASGNINVAWEDITTVDEMNEIKMQMAEFNQRLKAIEDQILIVRRDNALEEHFEELKEAWKAYNELADKLRTFRALQDSQ